MIDPKAKLLAVLDTAEKYRALAIRAKDRGERETYERIVEAFPMASRLSRQSTASTFTALRATAQLNSDGDDPEAVLMHVPHISATETRRRHL